MKKDTSTEHKAALLEDTPQDWVASDVTDVTAQSTEHKHTAPKAEKKEKMTTKKSSLVEKAQLVKASDEAKQLVDGGPSMSDQIKALTELVADLQAQLDAADGRLSAVESSGAAPKENIHDGKARVSFPDTTFATGTPASDDAVSRWNALQDKRANAAAGRKTGSRPVDSSRLTQISRELEGENISSVRRRLADLQTSGALADFKVIVPGGARPGDNRSDRILMTVDSHGFVISAEVG